MKPAFFLATLCVVFLGTFFTGACVSSRVTPAALFPAANLAWPGVREELDRGIVDGLQKGVLEETAATVLRGDRDRLDAALRERDSDAVRSVSWPTLEPWARRGVGDMLEDGEIGPGVAASLVERIQNFRDAILTIQGTF